MQKLISDPESILIVDDVVTTGATLVGSAKRLADAFPKAKITAFAAIRTVTMPEKFRRINDPVFSQIILYSSGKTHRDPD